MKKSMLALLLTCALLFGLLPTAQADSLGLYFGARQVNYKPENGVTLTVKAMHAAESDISFQIGDQRGNTYAAVMPKGRDEPTAALPIIRCWTARTMCAVRLAPVPPYRAARPAIPLPRTYTKPMWGGILP